MTSSATRDHIRMQNVLIAFRNMSLVIGECVVPAWRQLKDRITAVYEELQRAGVYHALPTWLPWRREIARRWPQRWLPSSASMMQWMKGETNGVDQR